MSDVLSQSQIDMLLKSMQQGDSDLDEQEEKKQEKEYKKYDFYSPKKFTKDRLKLIKGIYDNYCRIVASQLNGILRMNCDMEVMSVEEQHYHEFSNSLGENDIMELMFMKLPDNSKNPPILFHISQVLVVNMIDRMLGGEGDETDEADIPFGYTYTEIELALYERLTEYYARAIKEAWKNYLALDVESMRVEQSPSMFQEIGLDETVVIIMLSMSISNMTGYINICVPGNLLANVFSILDKSRNQEGAYDNGIANNDEIIMDKIRDSSLEMKVELGTAKLSFRDIYELKVDDVIDLNKDKNSDVTVYVAEKPWFEGKLGVHKESIAVKLGNRVMDNEELLEDQGFIEKVPAQ